VDTPIQESGLVDHQQSGVSVRPSVDGQAAARVTEREVGARIAQ